MPQLADIQTAIRGAVIDNDTAAILPRLIGGSDPTYRLSIHQRHYGASLVEALRRRYPAVDWLIGSPLFNAAALDFIHWSPPTKPCISEYGQGFPDALAAHPQAQRIPWIAAVGALEWRLGMASVAIDHPAIGLDALTAFGDVDLGNLGLQLQPGVSYLHVGWPVDDLVKLHLQGDAPDTFVLDRKDVWMEITGARGKFTINRIDRGPFAFRSALADGQSIADAIAAAMESDPAFQPGPALAALFTEPLVVAVAPLSAAA